MNAAADRAEIVELLHRYALAIDTADWELLRRVFSQDACADFASVGAYVAEGDSGLVQGADAIVAWLRAALAPFPDVLHFMSNHLVELRGDRASTLSYMHVLHMEMGGIYRCEVVRTAEGWRIARLALEERKFDAAAERLRAHMRSVEGA
jgi:hypothetical protein